MVGTPELTTDRERRARHESAHCAVTLACGHRVRHVSIDPPVTDIEFIAVEGEDLIGAALRSISALLAGRLVDPAEELADVPGIEHNDWDRAYRIAKASVPEYHVRPRLRASTERAETLLAEFSDMHAQITDRLLERGELSGDEIMELREEAEDDGT